VRPSAYLFRAAACRLRAHAERSTPEAVAKQIFKGDKVTDLVLRAATAPATTTGAGWADALAALSIEDFLMQIASVSAAAELIGRGLKLSVDHFASIRVPGRLVDASDAGTWTAEGLPVQVRAQRMTTGPVLTPKKLEVITSFTNEMIRQSNIEAISRALLTEACALALDKAVLGTQAGDVATPPGILYALVASCAGKAPVSLRTVASPLFNIPILESTALAATKTVIMVEPTSFASAFGAAPEFEVTDVPVFHYEDATPQNITGGTPSPAVPVRSLFQTDSIGLRLKLRGAWAMRTALPVEHVAFVSGVTW